MAPSKTIATITTYRLKDCPKLNAGTVTPEVLRDWHIACKRYYKHLKKEAKDGKEPEIVSLIADAMDEPRLAQWYHNNEDRLDALSLSAYIKEFAAFVLDRNWAYVVRARILSARQTEDEEFKDFRNRLENENALLAAAATDYSMTGDALRSLLEANARPALAAALARKPIPSTCSYIEWADEVQHADAKLIDNRKVMNDEFDARLLARKHRTLESRLSAPNTPHPQKSASSSASTTDRPAMPKLEASEKKLLAEHEGCYRCRELYADHQAAACTGRANAVGYKTITLADAVAAKSRRDEANPKKPAAPVPRLNVGFIEAQRYHDVDSDDEIDFEDDGYEVRYHPFTMPHILVDLDVAGPSTSPLLPLSVKALPDPGCPSTVISDELVQQLGLRRYPLPTTEDNLSTLLGAPMRSSEYVKFEVTSGKGTWSSGVHLAKITLGLPVPLLLGIPFLAKEDLVMDMNLRTVYVRDTGYDLAHPLLPVRVWQPKYKVPPPTPKKIRPPKEPRPTVTLENAPPARLNASKLTRKMVAAVRRRIDTLAFIELRKEAECLVRIEFADMFPTRLPNFADMPDHIYHRIRLIDKNKVVRGRGYTAAKKNNHQHRELLDLHLAAGRLRPSSSEHASPCFIIPKFKNGLPDDSILGRWINDYRELNLNTVRDNFPLPKVSDILSDCGKGKIYSKLDMTNAFFQTKVHPEDIHLTAVRTPWGLYEWTVMPMGGCNAPSTHQRRMTDALRPYLGIFCHAYLDDIVIWSDNIKEHLRHLRLVFEALRKAHIYCNLSKTELFSTKINFLGHVISDEGIQADPIKCERVENWPIPTTASNVRGFIGLTRYLSAFLPGLAEFTSILTPLTTKDADKVFPTWTEEHQKAFEAIKALVTSTECLTVIDYDDTTGKRIFVTTDASNRRTGAVLSFGDSWETARPVAYDSYQLNSAERSYPTHEKELLAIIKALKKWRPDLLGMKFEVYTDHRTLEFFQTQKDMSTRQKRWADTLADFDFEIKYVRGEDNCAADALSRMPDDTPSAGYAACALAHTRSPPARRTRVAAVLDISADAEFINRIKAGYLTDEFAKQVRDGIAAGSSVGTRERHGLLYVGDRLLIPNDRKVRETLYHLAHDVLGHFGFDKSYSALHPSFYWPNMRKHLRDSYIPSCVECQRNKARTSKAPGPLHPLPVPDGRFEVVALDFVGPLPMEDGFDMVLTITDTMGADVQIIPVRSDFTAAETALVLFNEWYCENGLMKQIICDRDVLFTSEVWAELCKLTGIRLKMSSSYHPETDGSSERTNKTVAQAIRYHVDINQKGWLKTLKRVRFAIMNTANSSTGFSPFQLKTGRSPRVIPPIAPLDDEASTARITAHDVINQLKIDVQQAQDSLTAAKVRQAYHANAHRAPEIFYEVGDHVMLSTENRRRNYKRKNDKRVAKFMPRYDGPYVVVKANSAKSLYTLRLPNNPKTYPGFHAKLLKPFQPNDAEAFPDRELPKPGIVVTEDGQEEVMIDKIVDERVRGRGKQYLVRWIGYGKEHDEWLPGSELEDNEALDVWQRELGILVDDPAV